MLQLGIAFAFVAILVDGASVCSPYGGDMSVPTESSVQVQLLTYPNSGDSGCTGEAVITKLQNGKASKLETATRTFSCCGGGGSTVVVQEDSNEAYTVTAGECTTFVGDADAEPVKLICEETTEIPISVTVNGQQNCNDINPEMVLPTFEGCISVGQFSYEATCSDAGLEVVWKEFSAVDCDASEQVTDNSLELGCNKILGGSIDLSSTGCINPDVSTDQRDLAILGVCVGFIMVAVLAIGIYCGFKAYDRRKFNRDTSLTDHDLIL